MICRFDMAISEVAEPDDNVDTSPKKAKKRKRKSEGIVDENIAVGSFLLINISMLTIG